PGVVELRKTDAGQVGRIAGRDAPEGGAHRPLPAPLVFRLAIPGVRLPQDRASRWARRWVERPGLDGSGIRGREAGDFVEVDLDPFGPEVVNERRQVLNGVPVGIEDRVIQLFSHPG